jgi:hypothetical protein
VSALIRAYRFTLRSALPAGWRAPQRVESALREAQQALVLKQVEHDVVPAGPSQAFSNQNPTVSR